MENEKYINGGRELVRIKDRKVTAYGYRQATRWIVWSETRQQVVSEHSSQKKAQEALAALH